MDDYATSIINDYEEMMDGVPVKLVKTPGFPGTTLTKSTDEEPERLDEYRSYVGKILHYVKKISPECSNAIRELATHMSNPNKEHWRAIERIIGYLKHKSRNGGHSIVFRKPRELRVIAYCDSNYATNPDDRKSVTGNIVTIGGTVTNWLSKKQPIVTLSSTEAEYVAATVTTQEVRFTQMLLDEIATNVLPGILMEDNTGCIYLVKNAQVGPRTKHIEVRWHYVRKQWLSGHLEIVFVRSEDNASDTMTKNITEKLFGIHVPKLLTGTLDCWREDVKMDVRQSSGDDVTTESINPESWKKDDS